jgi:valyl-tRNA synthetase
MIYAKYGIDALRSIARRWPVGGDDLSFTERVLRRFTAFANNTWCARLSMVCVFANWL